MPKSKHPEPKERVEESKVRSVSFRLGDRAPEGRVWYADVKGFTEVVRKAHELGVSGNVIVLVELEQRGDGAYAVVTYE